MQPEAANQPNVSLAQLAPVGSSSSSRSSLKRVELPPGAGCVSSSNQLIVTTQTEATEMVGASSIGGGAKVRLAGRSQSFGWPDCGSRLAAESIWSLPSASGSSPAASSLSCRSGSSSNWMMARLGRMVEVAGGHKAPSCGSSSSSIDCDCTQSDASEINIARTDPPTISPANSIINNDNDDDEIGGAVARLRCWCANEDELATDCCNRRQSAGSLNSNQVNLACHYHRERPSLPVGRHRHEHSLVCAKRRRRCGGSGGGGQIAEPTARRATERAVAVVVVAAAAAAASAVSVAPTTTTTTTINNTSQLQKLHFAASQRCLHRPQTTTTTTPATIEHQAASSNLDHDNHYHYYYDTRRLFTNCDVPLESERNGGHKAQQDNTAIEDATNSGSSSSSTNQQPSRKTRPTIIETKLATRAREAAREQHRACAPEAGQVLLGNHRERSSEDQLLRNQTIERPINRLQSSRSNRFNATEGANEIGSEPIVSLETLWQLLSLQQQQHHTTSSNLEQDSEEPPDTTGRRPEEPGVVAGRLIGSQASSSSSSSEIWAEAADRPARSGVAMEILRRPAVVASNIVDDRLIAPKTYPNNTVLVDLSKCHRNITHLLPHPTQVSTSGGSKSLTSRIWAGCWPLMLLRPSLSSSSSSSRGDSNGCHIGESQLAGAKGSRQRRMRRRRRRGAKFSYQIPESLLRTNVTINQEDYDKALSVLSGDVRYQLHLLLYRRVQTIWVLLSTILCILVPVLLANLESLMIVGACCLWLGLQIVGAFATTKFRKKLDQMLEKSVAQVNSYFMEHNLMLGVINVGGLLSKAKLLIPMLYFDTSQCREQIESIISIDSRNDADGNSNKQILDYTRIDLPLTKPNVVALAQSQLAKKIVLRYSQRWISYFDKQKLMFNDDRIQPRHLSTGKCLCQFIEEHFSNNVNLKQQQQQHNHPIKQNGKLKAPHTIIQIANNNGACDLRQPEEAPVQPKVIRKTTQMAPTVPTLSRLVSLKESHPDQYVKIDQVGYGQVMAQQKKMQPGYGNQLAPYSWYTDMGKGDQQHQVLEPGRVVVGETPPASAGSPDLSLEIGEDSISRSDELVRKLRLLLELRKNDLQGIDGSLFSGVLYKTPQSFRVLAPSANDDSQPNGSGHNDPSSLGAKVEDNNQQRHHHAKANEGKRFYTQREGWFYLSSNGAKQKIQQDTTNRTNHHVLEIC